MQQLKNSEGAGKISWGLIETARPTVDKLCENKQAVVGLDTRTAVKKMLCNASSIIITSLSKKRERSSSPLLWQILQAAAVTDATDKDWQIGDKEYLTEFNFHSISLSIAFATLIRFYRFFFRLNL